MRVLVAHNYYQQSGGEDVVFAAEAALLRRAGHEVLEYTEDNAEISSLGRVRVAAGAVWSRRSRHRLEALLSSAAPQIVHFHNTFPLISPSAYSICHAHGAAVVQTLHNYRLVCPAGLLYRDGAPCEECVGRRITWPSVVHGCYRSSRAQTAVVATMLSVHNLRHTWLQDVDVFIALTQFAKRKLSAGGVPEARLVVKANFIDPDPGERAGPGSYFLYLGRLTLEKGVRNLLEARRRRPLAGELRIAGAGELRTEVERAAAELPKVSYLGQLTRGAIVEHLRGAIALIVPSEWYEGFPMAVIEAFAVGIPVIASRIGSLAELVEHGRTGLLFTPGSPDELAATLEWACKQPDAMRTMGRAARLEYEAHYTAEVNAARLANIYERALSLASSESDGAGRSSVSR